MYQVNQLGRSYQKGKPLPIETRAHILQNMPYCTPMAHYHDLWELAVHQLVVIF